MLLSDLIRLGTHLFRPPPVASDAWVEKQTMILSLPTDLNVSWKAALVDQQVADAAALLRGRLWKRANGLGSRTVLVYQDRETENYLNLDLDTFIAWLGQNFILIELTTNYEWGFPNRCFAARLYDLAISADSNLQWIK
jgi:hypothetical protein